MISVGFERVSKKRPCRICGKPTYCGFSRDEGTSICMRIGVGSRGRLETVGIYTSTPKSIQQVFDQELIGRVADQIPLAPLKIRDAVLRS